MDVSVIKIGNSKGIRLSKTLLERYNINDTVELILEKGHIIIKPKAKPRRGWEAAFKKMHESGDDKALMAVKLVGLCLTRFARSISNELLKHQTL